MSITYLEAIRQAQAKLLRDDDRVFIYSRAHAFTIVGSNVYWNEVVKRVHGQAEAQLWTRKDSSNVTAADIRSALMSMKTTYVLEI